LEFNIFAKTRPGFGAGVKLFRVGVESDLRSDHLCANASEIEDVMTDRDRDTHTKLLYK